MDVENFGPPEEELGPLAARLLEVAAELIREALGLDLADVTVVADSVEDMPCIFLGSLYRAKRAIVTRLMEIAAGRTP